MATTETARDYCFEAFLRDWPRVPSFERQTVWDRFEACKRIRAQRDASLTPAPHPGASPATTPEDDRRR